MLQRDGTWSLNDAHIYAPSPNLLPWLTTYQCHSAFSGANALFCESLALEDGGDGPYEDNDSGGHVPREVLAATGALPEGSLVLVRR